MSQDMDEKVPTPVSRLLKIPTNVQVRKSKGLLSGRPFRTRCNNPSQCTQKLTIKACGNKREPCVGTSLTNTLFNIDSISKQQNIHHHFSPSGEVCFSLRPFCHKAFMKTKIDHVEHVFGQCIYYLGFLTVPFVTHPERCPL